MIKKNYLNTSHTYSNQQKKYNAIFSKDGEIQMFRRLADGIAAKCPSVFTPEMHCKGYVRFLTKFGMKRTVEISDLLIVCQKNNRIKISFLQAKKHHNKNKVNTTSVLDFKADLLQYDLLNRAPDVEATNKKYPFPPNILNFSPTKSLRTYGTFYLDSNNEINMLYSATSELTPPKKIPQSIAPKSHPQITLKYNDIKNTNLYASNKKNPMDCVGAKDVNTFADELMQFNIGAELFVNDPKVKPVVDYISHLLNNRLADVNALIDNALKYKSTIKYIQEKKLISSILNNCLKFEKSNINLEDSKNSALHPYKENGAYHRMLIIDCTDYNSEKELTNLKKNNVFSFTLPELKKGLKENLNAQISSQIDGIFIDIIKDGKKIKQIKLENDSIDASTLINHAALFNDFFLLKIKQKFSLEKMTF